MNKALDLISKLVCWFLSIIFFVVLFIYLIFVSSNKIITKDNVEMIISSLDIEMIIGEERIDDLYEKTDANNVDRDIVYGVINGKEFKDVLAKYYGNYIESLLYDKNNEPVTKSEIVNVAKINIDRVSNNLGIFLTEEEKDTILLSIDDIINEIVEDLSVNNIANEFTEEQLNVLRFIFGNGLKNVLLIIIAIIIILITLFRWSIYRFAIWTGIPSIIAGVFFIAFGQSINSMIQSSLVTEVSSEVIKLLETAILDVITKVGTITLVIGIVQILYYFISKKSHENVNV